MACEKSDGALSFLHSELSKDLAQRQGAEQSGMITRGSDGPIDPIALLYAAASVAQRQIWWRDFRRSARRSGPHLARPGDGPLIVTSFRRI